MSDLNNNNADKINPPLKANNLKGIKDILGHDLKKDINAFDDGRVFQEDGSLTEEEQDRLIERQSQNKP